MGMVISWMCVFSIVILCSNFFKFIYIELFHDNKASQVLVREKVGMPVQKTKRTVSESSSNSQVRYKKAAGESFSYQSYEDYRRSNRISR
ncbi:hypothetical protein J2Z35_000406 [Acetoanaerobium pronyense]|uniref:Uncharacterized protein n=1 Tax=Acetoanaerobium pronyense TaxID=1482736 RepID=A0ABS4KFT9_9FIRM|nr:hypothetical protein [Acetoanaerobium pronyense]MBP2026617.1 hypothetical protein [Acetoanaerobium pronyense]